jgi:hypothetical protein
MDRQEIENEVIDYKSNGKILSVMSKDEKYQILTASISGDLLERQELHNLLILATGNLEFQYDETRLYDEDFIDHLRNIFFTIYDFFHPGTLCNELFIEYQSSNPTTSNESELELLLIFYCVQCQ